MPGTLLAPIQVSGPVRVNGALSFSAAFTDVALRETHKASWTWGDDKYEAGTVIGKHSCRSAGIYTIKPTLTGSGGRSTAVTRKLVVCGACACTGGAGAFESPLGALAAAPGYTGAAHCAFMAASDKAAREVQGALVEFSAATLHLHSTRVEFVAASDAELRYAGRATVNGRSA